MPGRVYTKEELENPPQPVVLAWPDFQMMFYEGHRQGEHVGIVGPTGSGKTLLGLELCKIVGAKPGKDHRPSRVAVLSTKPRDDTVSSLGWPIIKKWPPGYGEEHVIVWPKGGPPSQMARRHRAVFGPLLDEIFAEGGQTVYIPEAAYFERPVPHGLGLGGTMEQFWSTARSVKLTVISDTQRPRHVTRLMWSEPSWLVIFPLDDDDDTRRVAQLSGRSREVWNIVPQLGEHEFLCIRRQRDKGIKEIYVSRVDAVTGVTGNQATNGNRRA